MWEPLARWTAARRKRGGNRAVASSGGWSAPTRAAGTPTSTMPGAAPRAETTVPVAVAAAAAPAAVAETSVPDAGGGTGGGRVRTGRLLAPVAVQGRAVAGSVLARVVLLIRLAFAVIEGAIALRVLFKVLGANPEAGFDRVLYRLTDPLVRPFHPIFSDSTINGQPFEVGSVVALVAYYVAAKLVIRVARILIAAKA